MDTIESPWIPAVVVEPPRGIERDHPAYGMAWVRYLDKTSMEALTPVRQYDVDGFREGVGAVFRHYLAGDMVEIQYQDNAILGYWRMRRPRPVVEASHEN